MGHALPPYVTIGIAILGAGIIASPPATSALPNVQLSAVRLANGENVALIIGPSGIPIPSPGFVDSANSLYIQPHFPGYDPQPLFTPEGNYALYTGVKSLTLDESEAQGVKILNNAITEQVANGNKVAIFGESQSSTISSMVMPELMAQHVSSDDVGFVLTGDPNLPNGGLFERLDGMTIPSLGITFNGATPDDLYPTTIYTQAYDGFADVPRYPIDFLADLNSIVGIQFVHPKYRDLTPNDLLPVDEGGKAIELPTVGDTMTTYYAIPLSDETVPYLPLLQLLLNIPGIGTPLADFLQPILTPLINLGYGDPDFAWSTAPANVPTEFGLFPSFDMTLKAFQESVAGIGTGIKDAMAGLAAPTTSSLPSLADTLSGLETMGTAPATDPGGELTHIINTLTSAFSQAYATLLPTADVATGVTVTIPSYDVQWFIDGLKDGNLLEAIGQPLANDVYLYQLAGGFEAFALISAFQTIGSELQGLF